MDHTSALDMCTPDNNLLTFIEPFFLHEIFESPTIVFIFLVRLLSTISRRMTLMKDADYSYILLSLSQHSVKWVCLIQKYSYEELMSKTRVKWWLRFQTKSLYRPLGWLNYDTYCSTRTYYFPDAYVQPVFEP